MGKPAYLNPAVSPPVWVEFPIAERIGSSPHGRRNSAISREHTDLELETEEGVFWNYPQIRRRVWELTFRCVTEAQLTFFETLHNNVDGHSVPFYFTFDYSESPMTEYLVRKDKDFLPQAIGATNNASKQVIGIYDYVFRIKEESAAAYILA